jgi:hypothetical protein
MPATFGFQFAFLLSGTKGRETFRSSAENACLLLIQQALKKRVLRVLVELDLDLGPEFVG